nr:oocyte zinc finger protein XlCOF22-like [Nerophis lumbriciformis]
MLRELMKQRLNLAVEEIYQLFERTIMEYEEELGRTKEEKERQGQILDAVLKSRAVEQQQEDMHQVLVEGEEEEPAELPHIKEEDDYIWSNEIDERPEWLSQAEEQDPNFTLTLPDEPHDERNRNFDPDERNRNFDPDSSFAPISDMEDDDDDDSDQDKPFPCKICHKKLSSKRNVQRHMLTHQKPKVFTCVICAESFPTRARLRSHKRRHADKPKFDCAECGITFTKLPRLKRHMAKHTGEKPFACSLCDKKFSWNYALKRHMRAHTSREHFSCPVCAKCFTTKWYIAVHMRTHTGEKPYQCTTCLKRFHFKNSFRKHTCMEDGQSAGNDDQNGGNDETAINEDVE